MGAPLTIGSLFSGIGGLELGLERSGLGRTIWQVEKDAFCCRVLAKHWPHAERFEDVRDVGSCNLRPVDVVCGGFPCQNLSHANVKTRTGLAGAKSGLWFEYARIVRELRPRAVVVENILDGWREWMPTVCTDLAEAEYETAAIRIDAASVGAPIGRPRGFVIAVRHADREGQPTLAQHAQVAGMRTLAGMGGGHWRKPPSGSRRMAPGVRGELHAGRRRYALGNAVVPDVGELIGHIVRTAPGMISLYREVA